MLSLRQMKITTRKGLRTTIRVRWLAAATASIALGTESHAALVGYTPGPHSVLGGVQGGGIIATPALVTNGKTVNKSQQGFNERQNVTLGAALNVDGGTIAAGTVVHSHMIFLNRSSSIGGPATLDDGVKWLFSGTILGVMSDTGGFLEAASTPIFKYVGQTYQAPMPNRGLEPGSSPDTYSVSGKELTVTMSVTQPGDWIRVITAVPDGATTLQLLGLGCLGLSFLRRRRD